MDHQESPSGWKGNGKWRLGIGGGLLVVASVSWWFLASERHGTETDEFKVTEQIVPNSTQRDYQQEVPTDALPDDRRLDHSVEEKPDVTSQPFSMDYLRPLPPVDEKKTSTDTPTQVPTRITRRKMVDPVFELTPKDNTKIVSVHPSDPIEEGCLATLKKEEPLITNQCRTGTLQMPDSWIQRLSLGELFITLLPDTLAIISTEYSGLKPGRYQLLVADKQGCTFSKSFFISGDHCDEQQKVFSPQRGEKWIFKEAEATSGKVTIFNRHGKQIKIIPFRAKAECFWDGRMETGNLAPLGGYIYYVMNDEGEILEQDMVYLIR